jgi:hypothetical protein
MRAHLLTCSNSEIAQRVARLDGVVGEAIVFVEEPADSSTVEGDIFAEMEPFTVRVGSVDDSRESLYTRLEGE